MLCKSKFLNKVSVTRLLISQSKVKELTREFRNKEEENEDQRRIIEQSRQEKRKAEKSINEVGFLTIKYTLFFFSLTH